MERTLVVKRLVLAVVLVAAGVFLYVYFSAFLPILLALLTAAIFEPLIRWLKKKMRRQKKSASRDDRFHHFYCHLRLFIIYIFHKSGENHL